MTSPSPRKGKGREMDETTPERDKTEDDTVESKLDSILKRMQKWEKESNRNNQPRSYPSDKKAGTTQTSPSTIDASSDINYNNDTNDSQLHSTTQDDKVLSDDGKNFDNLYSDDDKVPSASTPNESFTNMLHDTSDYAESEVYPPISYESENTYSRFRQNGADLMTRHMFSGKMNGKRPIYVPIYKRDKYGYLHRLKRNGKGLWEYVELEKLSESETRARLKLFVEPKTKKGYSKLEDSKPPKT